MKYYVGLIFLLLQLKGLNRKEFNRLERCLKSFALYKTLKRQTPDQLHTLRHRTESKYSELSSPQILTIGPGLDISSCYSHITECIMGND